MAHLPELSSPNQADALQRSIETIGQSSAVLAEQVREFSRDQLDTWKRVPMFAVRAQGISGYNTKYQAAYRDGLWLLNTVAHGHYANAIDLDNGEIVPTNKPEEIAPDKDILRLLFDGVDQFRAHQALEHLARVAAFPPSHKSEESLRAIREDQDMWIEEYGVTEVYERQRIVTAEEMARRAMVGVGQDLASR